MKNGSEGSGNALMRWAFDVFDDANLNCWDMNPEITGKCFIPNSHWDHAGAAYLLKKRGVRLLAQRNTIEVIQKKAYKLRDVE